MMSIIERWQYLFDGLSVFNLDSKGEESDGFCDAAANIKTMLLEAARDEKYIRHTHKII